MSLTEDLITFGKYKDFTLKHILKDRQYCKWLLNQEWFKSQYEYLYNRVKEYHPLSYFLNLPIKTTYEKDLSVFLTTFPYFYLKPLEHLEIKLDEVEQKCYTFYLKVVEDLKTRLESIQSYDIKAPTKWLQMFEKELGLNREVFKQFLESYDLPNITTIVEQIKSNGGIVYNGAKSYLIAKTKSLDQEQYWEKILKNIYKEELGTQYKFGNCIFDYVVIKRKTIFECKLGLKDFNEKQYNKYLQATDFFNVIYLIDTDCVINIGKHTIYTKDVDKYKLYLFSVKNSTKFIELLQGFEMVHQEHLETIL